MNPFLLRGWWRWKRAPLLSGQRLLTLLCVASAAWAEPALWVWALTLVAVLSGSRVYGEERQRGTLWVSGITAMAPAREAMGRLAGALFPVLEAWLCSFWLQPEGPVQGLLVLLWAILATGVALACSAGQNSGGAAITAGSLLLFSPLPAATVSYVLEAGDLPFRYLPSWWGLTRRDPLPLALGLALVVAWLTVRVRAGDALRARLPELAQGPRGLTPARQATTVGHGPPAPAPPGLADWLLRPFATNPFYRAYRDGYRCLYCGSTLETPGSALGPGFVLAGLIVMTIGHQSASAVGICVVLALIGMALSFTLAVLSGYRTMQAENEGDTWPLLLVTGLTPARVLGGKWAAAFFAQSGEWLVCLPAWAITLLFRPELFPLAFLHPALVGLGALLGLAFACTTRREGSLSQVLLLLLLFLDFPLVLRPAIGAVLGDLPAAAALGFTAQLTLVVLLGLVIVPWARARLSDRMEPTG